LLNDANSCKADKAPEHYEAIKRHVVELCEDMAGKSGDVASAVGIIHTWFYEPSDVLHSAVAHLRYISNYLKRYRGRGIPISVDQDLLISALGKRVTMIAAQAQPPPQAKKEDEGASKASVNELKSIVAAMKVEIKELKEKVSKLDTKNVSYGEYGSMKFPNGDLVKCLKCNAMGHNTKSCKEA
jgi:hypothetical protein